MGDPEKIHNWHRLDGNITSSGQPSEDELRAIRDLGVNHIVNLGLHSHEDALPDEAKSVSALGMTYIHIPVDFDNPTEGDFGWFCLTMAELQDAPVHVHCIANQRASAFLYRYRRDILGLDEAEARRSLERVWTPTGVWADFVARSPAG